MRGIAASVDFLVLLVPAYVSAEMLGVRLDDFNPLSLLGPRGAPDQWAALAVLATWHFAYASLLEYYFGRTVGKALFRLDVVTERLEPVSLAQAMARNVVRFLDYYAFIVMMFSPKRQRLGDFLARTVVRREPPSEDQDLGI